MRFSRCNHKDKAGGRNAGVGGGGEGRVGFMRPEPRLVYSTERAPKIEIGGVFLF